LDLPRADFTKPLASKDAAAAAIEFASERLLQQTTKKKDGRKTKEKMRDRRRIFLFGAFLLPCRI